MNCKDVQNKISDYLDGYVTIEEKTEIDEHLLQCSPCKQELDNMKAALEELKSLPYIEPPADFSKKLKARITLKSSSEDEKAAGNLAADKKTKRHNWSLWAAAAVLVFFVVGAGMYGMGFGPAINELASNNDLHEEIAVMEEGEKGEETMGIMEAPEEDVEDLPTVKGEKDADVAELEYKIELDRTIKEAEKTFDYIQLIAAEYGSLDFVRDIYEERAVLKTKLYSKDAQGFLEEVKGYYSFLELEVIHKEEEVTKELAKIVFYIEE